jgi:hypothetical protein
MYLQIADDSEGDYESDAPTKLLALQTPSFVLILCTDFVSGSTQAASRLSRVKKPCDRQRHGMIYIKPEETYRLNSLKYLFLRVELSFRLRTFEFLPFEVDPLSRLTTCRWENKFNTAFFFA